MDKNWDVLNPPHHFHPRFNNEGLHSPMIGTPNHDIPILIDLITSHQLENKNLRF